MISLKPLKESASEFQEPIRSVIQMQKDSMPEKDFVDFFISLRRKAKEMDNEKRRQ